MARLLIVAFILLEIAGFVLVGQWIGVLGTLLLVVLAAVVGAALLRRQGTEALSSLRGTLDTGRDPRPILVRGGFGFLAALLLILPGFFSDLLALALLVPAVQKAVARRLPGGNSRIVTMRTGSFETRPPRAEPPRDRVVEADWEEVSPPKRPTHPPSGWTRH